MKTINDTLELKIPETLGQWDEPADLALMTPADSPPFLKTSPLPRGSSVSIGTIESFDKSGAPMVVFGGSSERRAITARTTVELREQHAGRSVVLVFQDGDAEKPIILGVIQSSAKQTQAKNVEVERDGQRLQFTAEQEIVFRCGKASITLTRAGKVLIEGEYLLSRSTGANRIKGGSVQIN